MQILYIIFPVLGLITGIKNFYQTNKRAGLLIFAFFYGYTIFFFSGDALHYRDDFKYILQMEWGDYFEKIGSIYRINNDSDASANVYTSKPDMFALTAGFLVSRITDNPRWFFALISLVYFAIFFKFISEVQKYVGIKRNKGYKLIFLGLVFIVPFYVGVTGVRFWTALFVFAYFIMKYLNTSKKKYVLYTALSALIHYTFLFPAIIAGLAFFIRLNRQVLKGLILLAVVFSLLSTVSGSLQLISNMLDYIGLRYAETAGSGYLDEKQLSERVQSLEKTNWYVTFRVTMINMFFFGFFLMDFFRLAKWNVPIKSRFFENLYHFFFIISIFTLNLGSISRFVYIFYLLTLIRMLMIQFETNGKNLRLFNLVFVPVILIHVIVTFRSGFYTVDPLLLVSPSAILFFVHSDISLSELIVGH